MESRLKKVGVIGAGLMGHGIAQVVAMRGFEVTMTDVAEPFLQNGLDRIRESLDRLVEGFKKSSGARGIPLDEKERTLRAITTSRILRIFLIQILSLKPLLRMKL